MELLEKIITIKEPTNLNPEDKKPINFKDEAGNKYTLWKTRKNQETGEQEESLAYGAFKKLEYGGDGQNVGIVYKEEQKSFVNKENKTINFTQRTVTMLKNPSEIKPENQQPTTYTSPAMQQSKPVTIEKEQVNWDDVNFGKCKHAFLVEAFKKVVGTNYTTENIEKEAEQWATMSMRKLDNGTQTAQDIAGMVDGGEVIDDDIKVEGIPF